MNTTEILNDVIEKILSTDELPGVLSYALIDSPDIPSAHWSFMNRIIRSIHGTYDARGYRQWLKAGRHVKKGSKSFHILGPRMVKNEDDEFILSGFVSIPVFKYEDTEGEELDYMVGLNGYYDLIKQYPLMDIVTDLNLEIKMDFSHHGEAGSYLNNSIRLCNTEEATFFHELSHAIDENLGNILVPDDPMTEIVAELSAACMAAMYSTKTNLNFTREYLKGWSKGPLGPFVTQALGRVNAILEYIKANTHSDAFLTEGGISNN